MRVAAGTCSICGGAVTTISPWWGIIPPPVSCEQCGAVRAVNGPVVPMVPGTSQAWQNGTSDGTSDVFIVPDDYEYK